MTTDLWNKHYSNSTDDSIYYSVLKTDSESMHAIKLVFPDVESVNKLNFILFSTSGLNGDYGTLEEAEAVLKLRERRLLGDKTLTEDEIETADGINTVTYVIIHPRIICIRTANVRINSFDDLEYLYRLRKRSWEVIQEIGKNVDMKVSK